MADGINGLGQDIACVVQGIGQGWVLPGQGQDIVNRGSVNLCQIDSCICRKIAVFGSDPIHKGRYVFYFGAGQVGAVRQGGTDRAFDLVFQAIDDVFGKVAACGPLAAFYRQQAVQAVRGVVVDFIFAR